MRRRALVEGIEPTYAVLVEIGQYLDVSADAGCKRNMVFEDLPEFKNVKTPHALKLKIFAKGKPFQLVS